MSTEEGNKALARRLMEAFVNGDLDTIEKLLAPNFVDRSLLPGQMPSREGYKRSITEFRAAFSFADLTIEYQVAEGDMVATKFSTRCIHRGEFLGVPPSGEKGTYSSIRIHRIAGGQITDEWSEGNLLEWIMPFFEREIRARERLEQDLRVARSIQQASLPKEVPHLEGWHLAPYYRSAKEVGGDFYDFHLLPEGKPRYDSAPPSTPLLDAPRVNLWTPDSSHARRGAMRCSRGGPLEDTPTGSALHVSEPAAFSRRRP
jgi:predicted ester cyclase